MQLSFPVWSRKTRSIVPDQPIDTAKVRSTSLQSVRDKQGDLVRCTRILFIDGSTTLLACTPKEYDDKISAARSVPMTRRAVEGLSQALGLD